MHICMYVCMYVCRQPASLCAHRSARALLTGPRGEIHQFASDWNRCPRTWPFRRCCYLATGRLHVCMYVLYMYEWMLYEVMCIIMYVHNSRHGIFYGIHKFKHKCVYVQYVCMYVCAVQLLHKIFLYLISVPIPHGIGVETSITEHQQFHPCIKI